MGSTYPEGFPFPGGLPLALPAWGGVVVLAGCAIGYAFAWTVRRLAPNLTGRWFASTVLALSPILGLVLAVGRGWTALFRSPSLSDVVLALAFVPPAILLPFVLAALLFRKRKKVPNPALSVIASSRGMGIADVVARSMVQILGEELICVLPFLVFLSSLSSLHMPTAQAVVLSWVMSSVLFGLLHLPTYSWRVIQAVVLVGSGRFVGMGSYIITKNFWAAFITHLAFDWLAIGAALLLRRARSRKSTPAPAHDEPSPAGTGR